MCWGSPLQMLKFGIPVPAAQLKMIAEGLNPLVLECDPDKPLPKKYVVKDVVDEMEAYTDGPKLGEHEVYAKYFKVRCTQHVHGLVQASAGGGITERDRVSFEPAPCFHGVVSFGMSLRVG
jgi:hypothetical protein